MTVAGRRVAFLPRHGKSHSLPPHKVPYKANLWALQSLGVTRVLAPSAVGSLQAHIAPGDFVINDQFVDRTTGRADTFYDGPIVTHVSSADAYCPQLRALAIEATKAARHHRPRGGNLRRHSRPALLLQGRKPLVHADGLGRVTMTQYPEVILARELALCYVTLSLVTDYDAGLVADAAAVEAP